MTETNDTITFRDFVRNEQDYATMFAILSAEWPDTKTTAARFKHQDEVRNPKHYHKRVMALIGGNVVGYGVYGATWWNTTPDQYFLAFDIHQAYKQSTVGKALYNWMVRKLKQERVVKQFSIDSRADKVAKVAFLEAQGFVLHGTYPRSELEVATFNESAFTDRLARVAANGIQIRPLSAIIPIDPDYQRKIYDLEWVFEQDEPGPEEPTRPTFEEYVRGRFDSPSFRPESWFIATDGDRFVGWSAVTPNPNKPSLWQTGWTGVDRPYRRKGLAMAMKLHTIAYVREMGGQFIRTENEETNVMYQINLKLGYKPQPPWVDYIKNIEVLE